MSPPTPFSGEPPERRNRDPLCAKTVPVDLPQAAGTSLVGGDLFLFLVSPFPQFIFSSLLQHGTCSPCACVVVSLVVLRGGALGGVLWVLWVVGLVCVCVSRLLLVGFSKLVSRARTHDDDDDVMTTTTTMRSRFRLHFGTFHEPVVCGVVCVSLRLSCSLLRLTEKKVGRSQRKEERETAFFGAATSGCCGVSLGKGDETCTHPKQRIKITKLTKVQPLPPPSP